MSNQNKHIENYLNNFSQEKNKFSVPDNYFETIEDTVLSSIIEDQLPGGLSYNVPNDYFNTVEDVIIGKLHLNKEKVKVISLKDRLLKIIPTAAAACILLFVGFNYINISNSNGIESITNDEIELWINENFNEFSTTHSIEFVDTDFTDRDIIEEDVSLNDEDIIEYLNTIDNSSLLTEIES